MSDSTSLFHSYEELVLYSICSDPTKKLDGLNTYLFLIVIQNKRLYLLNVPPFNTVSSISIESLQMKMLLQVTTELCSPESLLVSAGRTGCSNTVCILLSEACGAGKGLVDRALQPNFSH